MLEQKSNILSIDGKNFPIENLKDEHKALIDQISFCQNEINQLALLVRKIDMYEKAKTSL